MDKNLVKDVQRELASRGYDLGPAGIDGVLGRATTTAVALFQQNTGLDIRWPGTIGPKTIEALGIGSNTGAPPVVEPAWIIEARRYLGLHERRDAAALNKALRLNAKEIPWCGAFVGMVIAATLPSELLPANPLGARNWTKFGVSIPEPKVGAIATFWRGAKSGWQGHTSFVVGHDRTHLHCLGGNQTDAVTISRIAKDRLLGYTWPKNAPAPDSSKLPFTTISASITTNEA